MKGAGEVEDEAQEMKEEIFGSRMIEYDGLVVRVEAIDDGIQETKETFG